MKTELTVKFDRRRFLENLVEELQVPPSRYEEAERRYKSLDEWLHRPGSIVRDYDPDVYVQGSFRLGTAIKPVSDQEDYDIDMVCCLEYEKSELTQAELKRQVGHEIKAYADRFQMNAPQEGRRCWTLDYADSAQFHMDILPSVPDMKKRQALKIAGQSLAKISATALAITDKSHPYYHAYSEHWPCSNPKGYALWFRDQMGSVFAQRAQRLVEQQVQVMSIKDVPNYRVRTPLQSSIQLLKRHRDVMFSKCSDEKPISILITTLAAHAYDGKEENLANTLLSILQKMDHFIEKRQGVDWVKNPADPEENFADKWAEHPERRDAFFEWLNQARKDFHTAMDAPTAKCAGNCLAKHLGESLVHRTLAKMKMPPDVILSPDHMHKPRWENSLEGWVHISKATYKSNRSNSSPQKFSSETLLPKYCSLRFKAETSITGNYTTYWQVVNTGREAKSKNGLRGNFYTNSSGLISNEETLYPGTHSIECFIIKNYKLMARSGQFIVRIIDNSC